jgi:hypothetical protein
MSLATTITNPSEEIKAMKEDFKLSNAGSMPRGEQLNPAEPMGTSLQLKQDMQAMQRRSFEVQQLRPDTHAQIVGAGSPSNRRHHPQRQNRQGHNK